jgi:hypothetical protein
MDTISRPTTTTMTHPSYADYLVRLGISSFPTGSSESAVDVLINMFAAIAAAAHPGSRLVCNETGQSFDVGIDTLTCGSASVGGLNDLVISPLRRLQNQNLRNTEARAAATYEDSKTNDSRQITQAELRTDITGRIEPLHEEDFRLNAKKYDWLEASSLSQTMAEQRARPTVLFDAGDPAQTSRQLGSCHLGKPIMTIRIPDAASIKSRDSIFLAITDGVTLNTELPYQVQGRVLASTSSAVLKELVEQGANDGIIGNALWLTGGSFGSWSWPKQQKAPKVSLQAHYENVLSHVMGARFTGHAVKLRITSETAAACMEFAQYLHTLEAQMPGIAGSLRSLIPTVIFGLSILYGCHRNPESKPLDDLNSVLSDLSRALAQRMVNHRQVILQAEQLKRLHHLAGALYTKLQDRPHTVRELIRRSNRLTVAECRDALHYLASMGTATSVDGDVWHLITGSNLPQAINIEATTVR